MSYDLVSELFIPYLPGWLRAQLGTAALLPGSVYECEATILYADLSGFTAITAAFATLPDGAEHLHEALSTFYSTLVTVVAAYEGDVVSIAGDALTAWWPERIDLERGRRCGAAMLTALAALPTIKTPHGSFPLDLRVGVAAGTARVVLTGLPSYGVHLTLYGPAIQAAVAAERNAVGSEVQVADSLICTVEWGDPHSFPAASTPEGSAFLDVPHLATQNVRLTAEHFLPPSFAERLRIGALVAEYRRCVPAFAAFTLPQEPADLHHLVARVQTIVSRWGGWLNEVEIGDKGAVFVLLFGAPVTRGDDPVRAVGCCLELRMRGLIHRAGITTGTLFVGAVGSSARRVYTAQGDEMNLAAHLMHNAAPGEILVSSRVQHEIAGRYHFSQPTMVAVKGHHNPLFVARVLSTGHRYGHSGRGSLHRYLPDAAPLIGRGAEQETLAQVVAAACGGKAQVILVEGESGIGKSSLLQVLMQRWMQRGYQGYSSDCSSGSVAPFFPWRAILADICGLDETTPLSVQLDRIGKTLSDRYDADPSTSPYQTDPHTPPVVVSRRLAYLLGLEEIEAVFTEQSEDPAIGPLLADSPAIHEAMLEAALALLQRRLAHAPLLIVLEDIHWADELSLRLAARFAQSVEQAAGAYPLVLALSHRPLDDSPPAALVELRNFPGCTRLNLGSLSSTESSALLRLLLHARDVPRQLDQIVERYAQGQPLFIKEYVQALRKHNAIVVDEGTVHLEIDPATIQPSDTIQGLIQARVDRLDETTRLTLKVAAVIGRTFPLSLLRGIHPAGPPWPLLLQQLEQLAALQIVELELDDPERVYRFKHNITHEVAYASLLFGQRRPLHTAAAEWYESAYADDIARDQAAMAVYQLLAHHYRRAENTTMQARYYRAAAEQAARHYANTTAIELLATTLALTSDPVQRYDLLLLRIALYDRIGERTSQNEDITALATLAVQLNDELRLARAHYCRMLALLHQGAYQLVDSEVNEQLQRVVSLVARSQRGIEHQNALLLHAAYLDAHGTALHGLQDMTGAYALHKQALALCWQVSGERRLEAQQASASESSRQQRARAPLPSVLDAQSLAARCLDNLGRVYGADGEHEQALRCHQQALSVTRSLGDWIGDARALCHISEAYLALDSYELARQHAERALTVSHAIGDRMGQAIALHRITAFHVRTHSLTEAQRCAMHALAISSQIGATALSVQILDDLAEIALALGDIEDAQAAREEAEAERLQSAGTVQFLSNGQ